MAWARVRGFCTAEATDTVAEFAKIQKTNQTKLELDPQEFRKR